MTNLVVSMVEPGQKLGQLDRLIPKSDKLTQDFGRFLARSLGQEDINPLGFIMGYELALCDLQAGLNGITGEKIKNSLTGYPETIYTQLRMWIPKIAEVIFPPDFATAVKDAIKQIDSQP